MGIFRCNTEVKVEPKIVAAIIAALEEMLGAESERREVRPYVRHKNRSWKAVVLQENCFTIHFLRR